MIIKRGGHILGEIGELHKGTCAFFLFLIVLFGCSLAEQGNSNHMDAMNVSGNVLKKSVRFANYYWLTMDRTIRSRACAYSISVHKQNTNKKVMRN